MRWKVMFFKILLLLKTVSHFSFFLLFTFSELQSHYGLDCLASYSLANQLCNLMLPLSPPFWNNYFFNISIVLLLHRLNCLFLELILIHFSRTFARWLLTSFFFFHNFPDFFILKHFKAIKSWLNTATSSHHTLHLASSYNISPHFLRYPSFTLPHSLFSPFSLSPALLSLQVWCQSKYFSIHFLSCKCHYTWTLSSSACIS